MQLQAPPPRPAPSDDNLIPMINVVFLLLVFFMVAGTIRPSDPLPITAPLSRSGGQQTAKPVLYIKADGAMTLNETPLTATRLTEALAKLPAASTGDDESEPDLNASNADSNDRLSPRSLAMKADADISVALLREVLDELRLAGVHTVELITVQAIAAH